MSFCAGFLLVANRHVELQEAPISSEFLDFYHRATMSRSACARTRQGTPNAEPGTHACAPKQDKSSPTKSECSPAIPATHYPNERDDDASASPVTRFKFHSKALAFKVSWPCGRPWAKA